jgi:hypothetical protein
LADISNKIVEASIGLFVLAFVGLLALTQLFTAPTTSIPATITALVITLVAVMFGLAIALLFYRYTKGKA